MKLADILQDSDYQLTQFSQDHITRLENSIFLKEIRGKQTPYIKCLVRQSDIQLKPEEVVRQLYLMKLNEEYGYAFERMQVEYPVSFGRQTKLVQKN